MSLRYVQSVVKRSCITITDVLSVSAYNTITTKPIAKKVFNGMILPKRGVRIIEKKSTSLLS